MSLRLNRMAYIIHNQMVISELNSIDAVFRALADPTRRAMLRSLASGPRHVGEMVKVFKISQPAVTKHLGVLERAGLIDRHRDGRFRNCHLKPEALKSATEWMRDIKSFWEEGLYMLEELLYAEEESDS